MQGGLRVDWPAAFVFITILSFLLIRWRRLSAAQKPFTRSEAAKIAILGAGFPAAIIVCLIPFSPSLLSQVADKPAYLLPMGFIMVMYSLGDLFDWDT